MREHISRVYHPIFDNLVNEAHKAAVAHALAQENDTDEDGL